LLCASGVHEVLNWTRLNLSPALSGWWANAAVPTMPANRLAANTERLEYVSLLQSAYTVQANSVCFIR
jgi:hypothetical protein